MLLHVEVMSLHAGVMRRAICDYDILHVDVISEHVGVIRPAVFGCDLCGVRSSIAIFGCDLFFRRGPFVHCLFRNLLRTLVHADVMCLHVDGTTLMQGFDTVAFLWTRLFWMRSLSNAVSFGCRCYSSDASAILWKRVFSSDADAFLGRSCSSLDAGSYRGVLPTFTRLP